jgi:hypothetical protein
MDIQAHTRFGFYEKIDGLPPLEVANLEKIFYNVDAFYPI